MATLAELRNSIFKTSRVTYNTKEYWNNHIKRDPFLKDIFMTLDLVFGNGAFLRIAEDIVTVTSQDGNIIVYEPGLQEEPSIPVQFTFGQGQASLRNFTVTLDGRIIDALSIVKSGNFLTGIAEVCLQVQNGIYENRLILMRGEMSSSIIFGVKEEMIELQLSDINLNKDKIIPEYLVLETDFPSIPDDSKGVRFPIIKDNCSCSVPCIRTSMFEYGPTFIVGFGHDLNVVDVLLNGISVPSSDLQRGWRMFNANTLSGIPYTALEFVFPVSSVLPDGTQVEGQAWSSSDSVYAKIDGARSRSIIALIRELIIEGTTFGADIIDEDLFSRSESKVPNLQADLLINGSSNNEATKALEYIENTICTSFPMFSMMYSNNGIGIVVVDRRSNRYINKFIVGSSEILDRSTGISELARESLYNSFTLRYDFSAVDDTYRKTVTRNASNSLVCKVSENRIGKRDYNVIDSVIINNDSTAQFVIEWLADHFALPSYYVEYECISSIYLTLKVGDNILITDHEIGFVEEKATVEKLEYIKGKVTLGVRYWIIYGNLSKSS